MKKTIFKTALLLILMCLLSNLSWAQCAICTKTANQLGDAPARGLNAAIIYLMFTPLLIMGYLGYRWFKSSEQEV